MNDRPRPRAIPRAPTSEDLRLVERLPRDLVRKLNRILDDHQAHKGTGRVVKAELHLDDKDGHVTPRGSCVYPPKEWVEPDPLEEAS